MSYPKPAQTCWEQAWEKHKIAVLWMDLKPRFPKTWTDNFSPFIFDLPNTGLVKIYENCVAKLFVISIQWI